MISKEFSTFFSFLLDFIHFYFLFFNHSYCYSIIVVHFFTFCPPPPIPQPHAAPTVNSDTVVHVHGSFIHVLCPAPSPSFHHYPPPSPLVTFNLFHVSMPMVLFCSLVYFVCQITLISEIIWYLSFTAWLISLSIMLSSSTHAVAKGRSSFFLLLCSILLCKYTTVF